MDDLIRKLSKIRSEYNCFDENERDAYHTLSEAIKALSDVPDTNVGDTISRQAAIDALGERPMAWTDSDYELGSANQYDRDRLAIETVPSADAQPEKRTEKHAETHGCDLISRQAAIDFIDAGHLVDPNEPRWSDNDVVNFLRKRPSVDVPHWIPCSERMPDEDSWAIWCSKKGVQQIARFKTDAIDHFFPSQGFFNLDDAVAWMPLPEPYKDGEQNG